ncbi:hypothetical protein MTO96_043058 [Rhipicephalus appendiculatus]
MIYWRQKGDNGGDIEDYYPGDVIELAESKQELARKVQKRRLRWPDNVFDEALGSAPCEKRSCRKHAVTIAAPVSSRRYQSQVHTVLADCWRGDDWTEDVGEDLTHSLQDKVCITGLQK